MLQLAAVILMAEDAADNLVIGDESVFCPNLNLAEITGSSRSQVLEFTSVTAFEYFTYGKGLPLAKVASSRSKDQRLPVEILKSLQIRLYGSELWLGGAR